jgi:hypothetical protein
MNPLAKDAPEPLISVFANAEVVVNPNMRADAANTLVNLVKRRIYAFSFVFSLDV